jgi:hypothetical protein
VQFAQAQQTGLPVKIRKLIQKNKKTNTNNNQKHSFIPEECPPTTLPHPRVCVLCKENTRELETHRQLFLCFANITKTQSKKHFAFLPLMRGMLPALLSIKASFVSIRLNASQRAVTIALCAGKILLADSSSASTTRKEKSLEFSCKKYLRYKRSDV